MVRFIALSRIRARSLIKDKAAQEDPEELRKEFPPLTDKRVPMGDVFNSCNWVMRDGWVAVIFLEGKTKSFYKGAQDSDEAHFLDYWWGQS